MNQLHQFVFGQIGLLPYDYYTLLPDEFWQLCKGYELKQYHCSHQLRYATFINILPHIKDMNFAKFCKEYWPLSMDKEMLFREPLKEMPIASKEIWAALQEQMQPQQEYEQILKRHNIKKTEAK